MIDDGDATHALMRRVLMVSPHFPPDSSAASHRVRLLAPHLADGGLDADGGDASSRRRTKDGSIPISRRSCRPSVRVVRAPAWPAGADAARRPRRSRAARVHRPAPHLPDAADARAVRRAVHHGVSRLSGAARRRAEGRVRRAVRARLPGSRGSARGDSRSAAGRAARPTGRAARRAGSATWLEPRAVQRRRCDRRRVAGHDRRHRRADPGGGAAAARRHPARVRAGRLRVAARAAADGARTSIRPTASCICATSARCCRPASRRCGCCCARSTARGATIRPPRGCACTSSAPATSRTPTRIACCRSRASAASPTR